MITGTIPLICLWLLVIGTTASLALHMRTPWRTTLMGRHLAVYIGVLAVWWTLILLGSYLGVPRWLEILQAIAFMAMPPVVWWRVVLQIRARKHPLSPKRSERTNR